nr:MAG: major capsid protein [Microviridae sp.]
MGTILNKIGVKTGVDSSNHFNLSCFHATSARFYSPRCTYFHEFVGNEVWKMDARLSVKCLPMIKPTMCDIKVHNRFFFVPYYAIMERWKEFLADTPAAYSDGKEIPVVPTINENVLVSVLSDESNSIHTSAEDYDYWVFNTGSRVYYKFTEKGRTIYTILLGLGYNINFNYGVAGGINTFSALPLLAYYKVWLDWYSNTAFDDTADLSYLFALRNSSSVLTSATVMMIFNRIVKTYLEKDYFTSATLNPVGTNKSTLQSGVVIPDFTTNSLTINGSVYASGTPSILQNSATQQTVASKYSIDAVNALTDYVKRHQLAGIQPFNRILAEYGVTISDEALKRSTFIGDLTSDVNVDEVLSNGYADDTVLGERAGFANAGGQKHLDFHNKNHGCIICVTTIVPRSSYTDGVKKHCLRINRLDYFTPSFEHLGMEPVAVAELRNNFVDTPQNTTLADPNGVFGYMPRYAAYKTALDTISGCFAVRSKKSLFEPWVLKRQFKTWLPQDYQTISENFTVAKHNTVNSPFVTTDADEDTFIIFCMWHVNAKLPMHKLFDEYQWSNENDNPKEVTIANQGVQLT